MPSVARKVNALRTELVLDLEKRRIAFDLKHVRADAIMVQIYDPG
jgi:hypothetical protein